MKIEGRIFTCESPLFVYFKKHDCPCCRQELLREKVSKMVPSDSEEAKKYDFEIDEILVKGNMRITHIAFFCPACKKQYSVKEIKDYESLAKRQKKRKHPDR